MTGLTDDTHGCTHTGVSRPTHCRCGQLAAFWTLPDGDCDVCHKPTHYYDPDGPSDSHPWCVGCRDRIVTPQEEAVDA